MNLAIKARRLTDAYELAFDRAVTEISDALLAGESIKCGQFTASLKDCAEYVNTRPEADKKMGDLLTRRITADQYEAWARLKQYDYACDMAVHKADEDLADEADYAEYLRGDR